MSLFAAGADQDPWSWQLGHVARIHAPDTDPASADIVWQPFNPQPRPGGQWHKRRRLRAFSSDEEDSTSAAATDNTRSLYDLPASKIVVADSVKPSAASSSDSEGQASANLSKKRETYSAGSCQTPLPLTMKETQRLLGLIKVLFRFKIPSSRRLLQEAGTEPVQRAALTPQEEGSSTGQQTVQPITTTALSHPYLQDLKPKYSGHVSSSAGSSRSSVHSSRKSIARVHPRDAFVHSRAAKRLAALLPATFPERIEASRANINWFVDLALQATRDSNGNILLPDAAFVSQESESPALPGDFADTSADHASGTTDVTLMVSTEQDCDPTPPIKYVTRSARHQHGLQPPSIPLPAFWRHKDVQRASESPVPPSSSTDVESDPPEREIKPVVSDDASETTITPHQPVPSSQLRSYPVTNHSIVLAQKTNAERQAQKLLLRTHKSLRKPSAGAPTPT